MQKVHYLHQNPVRAGLVEKPEDYRWSSARHWLRKPLEDEPLILIRLVGGRDRGIASMEGAANGKPQAFRKGTAKPWF